MNADLRGLIEAVKESRDALQAFANDGMPPSYVRHMEAEAALDAALEAAELSVAQGQGWLPIESAPTNGLLLAFHPRFGQRIMRPDPHNAGWYLDETGGPTREVTHWQPLPAAPAQPDGVE